MSPQEFDEFVDSTINEAITIMHEGDTKVARLIEKAHDAVCVNKVTDHTPCSRAFARQMLNMIGWAYRTLPSDLNEVV